MDFAAPFDWRRQRRRRASWLLEPMDQSDYLKSPQNQPHLKVMEVLRRWDPIGVITSDNQDEYDSYSVPIVRMLDVGATVDELLGYMHWIVTDRMGIRFDEPRARRYAEELVHYWPSSRPGLGSCGFCPPRL